MSCRGETVQGVIGQASTHAARSRHTVKSHCVECEPKYLKIGAGPLPDSCRAERPWLRWSDSDSVSEFTARGARPYTYSFSRRYGVHTRVKSECMWSPASVPCRVRCCVECCTRRPARAAWPSSKPILWQTLRAILGRGGEGQPCSAERVQHGEAPLTRP